MRLLIIDENDKILGKDNEVEFIPQENNLVYLGGIKYIVQGVAFDYEHEQIIAAVKKR